MFNQPEYPKEVRVGFGPNHDMSEQEWAAAEKARLFRDHLVRGSLGTFYQMFPLEMPPETAEPEYIRKQRHTERER